MVEVILLAAGRGRRLGAIGRCVPKVLLPLGQKRLIDYTLDALEGVGCIDLTVVLGHEATKVINHLLNRKGAFNYRIIINNRYRETNNLYSVYLALQSLKQESFILINGDVLFHPFLVEKLLPHETALLVDIQQKLGREEMKVTFQGLSLIHISKTINSELAMGEYVGLAKFGGSAAKRFYKIVHRLLRDGGKDMFYEAAIDEMAKSVRIPIVFTDGLPWVEIDTIQDLIFAKMISPIISVENRPLTTVYPVMRNGGQMTTCATGAR